MAGSAIRQSFCSALQAEIAEFYRLMAVLQEQSMREAPKSGNLSAGRSDSAFYNSVQILLGSARRLACSEAVLLSWSCMPGKWHFSGGDGW